jgi:hypothetical protein
MKEYRTFGIACLAACLLTYGATKGGVKGEDLSNLKWGLVGIVSVVGGRSIGRAAAGGGGLKGIGAALVTAAKPDGEAPAAPAGT